MILSPAAKGFAIMDVSFIVPAYKPNTKWLKECIEAIIRTALNHSQLKCEILVGDDGSPAGMFECENELNALSPMIKVFRFPENRGPGPTRNALIEQASGRYIIPQDCDDIMLPFDLTRVVSFLDEHPEYIASYSRKYCFNDHGLTGEVHGDAQSPFLAFFQPRVNINCMLIRKKECIELGGFTAVPYGSINEDVWLIFRMFEYSRIFFDSTEPRTLYRMHSSQITQTADDTDNDWQWMAHDMLLKHADIASEILRGVIPQEQDSCPERLITALTGAVIFLHQKNHKLCNALFQQMLPRHPEDHGIWETYLTIALNMPDDTLFNTLYNQAMEYFADSPERQYHLVMKALTNAEIRHLDKSKLLKLFRDLAKTHSTPPEIVRANAPAPAKQKYTWKI